MTSDLLIALLLILGLPGALIMAAALFIWAEGRIEKRASGGRRYASLEEWEEDFRTRRIYEIFDEAFERHGLPPIRWDLVKDRGYVEIKSGEKR